MSNPLPSYEVLRSRTSSMLHVFEGNNPVQPWYCSFGQCYRRAGDPIHLARAEDKFEFKRLRERFAE